MSACPNVSFYQDTYKALKRDQQRGVDSLYRKIKTDVSVNSDLETIPSQVAAWLEDLAPGMSSAAHTEILESHIQCAENYCRALKRDAQETRGSSSSR